MGCIPTGASRGEPISVPFLASRGHPHPLVCGLFPHFQNQQQSIFQYSSLSFHPYISTDSDHHALLLEGSLGSQCSHPDNPGQSPHLKIPNVVHIPAVYLLAHKAVYSQVPRIRTWTSLGDFLEGDIFQPTTTAIKFQSDFLKIYNQNHILRIRIVCNRIFFYCWRKHFQKDVLSFKVFQDIIGR